MMSRATPTRRTVVTAQCAFSVGFCGAGSPVLLIPGGVGTSADWDATAAAIGEAGRAVIIPDLPGTGGSGTPREGYDRAILARSLVVLVKALGHERLAVVGHGIGGFLAIEMAAATPYVVERLVLVAPTIGGMGERVRRLTADEAMAEQALYQQASTDEPLINHLLGGAARTDDGPLLGAIECPTLIVRGDSDATFGAERARAAGRLIGNAFEATIEGVGHRVHAQRPAEFVDLIVRFLSGR
ncbi:MAG: alpha/beta hydrolase [Chloroflexi bacterium]|nr:alpha/beta hydrolase [Chloroflexota bacterium]